MLVGGIISGSLCTLSNSLIVCMTRVRPSKVYLKKLNSIGRLYMVLPRTSGPINELLLFNLTKTDISLIVHQGCYILPNLLTPPPPLTFKFMVSTTGLRCFKYRAFLLSKFYCLLILDFKTSIYILGDQCSKRWLMILGVIFWCFWY